MRKVALLGWVLAGCAHEQALAARALQCQPTKVALVAEAQAREYAAPRETAAAEAALAGASAAVGAIASLVGASQGNASFYLPAGSVQLAAPGWRFYEGCSRGLLCFDGGFCLRAEDAALEGARRVPVLMSRSAAELAQKLTPEKCEEAAALPDRRGVLVWTLSRCSESLACKVDQGTYRCSDLKGRAVER